MVSKFSLLERKSDGQSKQGEKFRKEYRSMMELLDRSHLARCRPITEHDHFALGIKLHTAEQWLKHCQRQGMKLTESGSINDLGVLKTSYFDLITVNYMTDAINLLAGTQPLESPVGFVLNRKVKAKTTKGNVTINQILKQAFAQPDVWATSYADGRVENEVLGTGDGTATTFSLTVAGKPIQRGSVSITVEDDPNVYGNENFSVKTASEDVGDILGKGGSGTVNYNTGLITFTTNTAVANTKKVFVKYSQNYEEDGSYPKINGNWDQFLIMARLWSLGYEEGLIESFTAEKIAGFDLTGENTKMLAEEMTKQMTTRLIADMYNNSAQFTTYNFDRTVPSGVSEYHHRKAFNFKVSDASTGIFNIAGRGKGNLITGSPSFCSYLESMGPEYWEDFGFENSGIHIRGKYKGIPVICSPQANLADTGSDPNKVYHGMMTYRGTGNFDVPSVIGVFIPYFQAGSIPVLNNLLKKQSVGGTFSAVENLVPSFTVRLSISAS